MPILVTGSGGLIGSETASFFCRQGREVIGIDNDLRRYFFGDQASTLWNSQSLQEKFGNYSHHDFDIRDGEKIDQLFQDHEIEAVVHTAAQPSHDWAAKEPKTDFSVNAMGTMNLLEATRQHHPKAPFLFTSTNKVYGDTPNRLPLIEEDLRWEIDPSHPYHKGIDESMSIDQSKHSLFGVSKVAADVLVQEYGRYFNMNTMVFRGGCLTGPMHSGAELHGFLAYLVQCILSGKEYRVLGYRGKQVRDNIHAADLVSAFDLSIANPRPGEVYNMGGGRFANISMLEAIHSIENLSGKKAKTVYVDENREGDHIWYISNTGKFSDHFPSWSPQYNMDRTLSEMIEAIGTRLG
jgi:CDP-paratose 2-epimerase